MNSDALYENMEAISLGLEPPHCDVWVADVEGVLHVAVVTDAHRMSALRNAREA